MNNIKSQGPVTPFSIHEPYPGLSPRSVSSSPSSVFSNAARTLSGALTENCVYCYSYAPRSEILHAKSTHNYPNFKKIEPQNYVDFLDKPESKTTNQNLIDVLKTLRETDIDTLEQSTLHKILEQLNNAAIQAGLKPKNSIGLMVQGLGPVKFTVRESSKGGLHFSKLNANQYQ